MSVIKSLSVGDGDMFYIQHNSDNFTMIDCCMSDEDQEDIVSELKSASAGKNIIRFISTHPDDDHIDGLVYLNQQFNILNFYCVENSATKEDQTDDFLEYCKLRDDPKRAFHLFRGCSRKWMNEQSPERGSAGISILWPIISNEFYIQALKDAQEGESPNNISTIVKYSLNEGASVLWMGDLESDFMENIIDAITLDSAHVLFAPHHGRKSGKVPGAWLSQIDPKVVIIGEAPSEDLDYYSGYDTITQNTAGDITLDCESGQVHFYVSNPNYSVTFLDDLELPNTHGTYIGTLST